MADGLRRLESLGLDPLVAKVAAVHQERAGQVAERLGRLPPLEVLLIPKAPAASYAAALLLQAGLIALVIATKVSGRLSPSLSGFQIVLGWSSLFLAVLFAVAATRYGRLFFHPVVAAHGRARLYAAASALGPHAATLLARSEKLVEGEATLEELSAAYLRQAERAAQRADELVRIAGTLAAVLVGAAIAASVYLPIFNLSLGMFE